MKLVTVTLMFLGSFAFLGADTARLEASSQFRKKWNKWALSHGKKELQVPSSYLTGLADEKMVPTQTLVQLQDKESTSSTPQASPQSITHIRVKRYRQSMNQGSRSVGCRFGTCTVQKLAHQIYQLTDKDKDGVAPGTRSVLMATAAGAGVPCQRISLPGLWCPPRSRHTQPQPPRRNRIISRLFRS